CPALQHYRDSGAVDGEPPPSDPTHLPVDSEARLTARVAWEAYWAARSKPLKEFMVRVAAIEAGADEGPPSGRPGSVRPGSEKAQLASIRRRVRALRALLDELGCPAPPWTTVSPDLIWNIQNAPAAQITMLLEVHGAAWAPVGACSTFGVALKC